MYKLISCKFKSNATVDRMKADNVYIPDDGGQHYIYIKYFLHGTISSFENLIKYPVYHTNFRNLLLVFHRVSRKNVKNISISSI